MTDRSRLEILEDKLTLQILLVIRDNPHSTRSRICELSPGAKQTTLKRLDLLLENGLTNEVPSPTHRRGSLVTLTMKGDKIVAQVDAINRILDGEDVDDAPIDYSAPPEQRDHVNGRA